MEAEHNAQLLEASRSEQSRWQCNLVLGQVLHNILNTVHILGELLVVSLVSLLDLPCFFFVSMSRVNHFKKTGRAYHRSSHRQDPAR